MWPLSECRHWIDQHLQAWSVQIGSRPVGYGRWGAVAAGRSYAVRLSRSAEHLVDRVIHTPDDTIQLLSAARIAGVVESLHALLSLAR